MAESVKSSRQPRTRRAEQSREIHRRIVEAATTLFAESGYPATTLSAVAERADVAVETIYSRFQNKANLLAAVLEPAITGNFRGIDLFDLPEIAAVRASTDQREQVRLLAHFSRGILERSALGHRILRTAASTDPEAAELARRDFDRRVSGQKRYIEILLANGALRPGLAAADAASTYSALSNPATYAFLIEEQGWAPQKYEDWLDDCLTRLLLAGSSH